MIDKVLSFIAPHRCYGCLQIHAILCPSCYNDIKMHDFAGCVWCAAPTNQSDQCGSCAVRTGTSGAWMVGERSGVLKRLVGNYKYESTREAAGVLAQLLDERVAVLPVDTVVTAVPTINRHIRQRGFDHAATLAQEFAELRKLTYAPLLKRTRQTLQHQLDRTARIGAARESFGLRDAGTKTPVMLIDDIITTGATLEACSRLLREAGATQIFVGVIARQPLLQEKSRAE